jgi:predicted signal transduction protein with EAL and GGDEF domain
VDCAEAALAVGHRVREALSQPAVLSFGPVQVAASIGVACSEPAVDGATLTRRADAAMYASKQNRDREPVLFDTEMGLRPGA